MRVLHVISDENIGGAGVLLCNLLAFFSKEVESAVALPKNSQLKGRVEALSVPVLELSHSPHRLSLRSVFELILILYKGNYQIIHANAALSARVAGRLTGRQVVHTRHCFYPISKRGKSRFSKWINHKLSHAAIATSAVVVENLLEMGIPACKIHTVVNGSPAVREVGEDELEGYRQKWGIEKAHFVVGICARMEECKGQDVFLRAAREAVSLCSDRPLRFLIAGTGSQWEEMKMLATRLGIDREVVFVGFLDDPAPFYRLLSLNVNCSRGTETSCLALSEGMSAGVPMAATDYGGNPYMIGEEGAGFLYPVDDAHALARIIAELSSNPRLEREMSRKALERYRTHFTARRMAEETERVYASLLEEKG